jgi:hypothetical protein
MAASLNVPLPLPLSPSTPSLALLRLLADLDQKVAHRFGFSQNRMPLIEQRLVALSNEEMLRLVNCSGTRSRAVRRALRSAA